MICKTYVTPTGLGYFTIYLPLLQQFYPFGVLGALPAMFSKSGGLTDYRIMYLLRNPVIL